MGTSIVKSQQDGRHLVRFLKAQAKVPVEDIARQERVSVDAVRKSIRFIERFRSLNSRDELEYKIHEHILTALPAATKSLVGLLEATELVEMKDHNTGKTKVVTQADKTTRLEANRIVKDIIVGVQPKTPMVEVNNNQTNQVANLTAETMEERLDRLRKKAQEENLLPPEVRAVPEELDNDGHDSSDDDEDEDEEE